MLNRIIPNSLPKDSDIGICKMSITYTQNPDTTSPSDEYQYLTIESVPCDECADFEEGKEPVSYYNIKIGLPDEECCSPHWSIEDPEDLANIVRDFISRQKIVSKFDK